MNNITYKDAGVDINAGNSFVENIKPFVAATKQKGALGNIGSFAGAFELPSGYNEPVMLAATDGVGTKLRLAIDAQKYETVGIDLVAMCVNDLICNFATPSFFLDYYATASLDIATATAVVKGISQGCIESECTLIGGETAEMPNMYAAGDFDLAGFAVGVAEKSEIDRTVHVKEGDLLIALPSSGIHSNGFSLVRKVLFETMNMQFHDDFNGVALIDELLKPTRIYVKDFKALKPHIHAMAHITGGGIVENLPRVFPKHLGATVEKSAINVLPIFQTLQERVAEAEMYKTFNMGVGAIVVCAKENVDTVLSLCDGYCIGEVSASHRGVQLV